MMVQNEGKRIILMIWILVGAGLIAGAVTLALFGWHLSENQVERGRIIARGKQPMRANLLKGRREKKSQS